MTDRKTFSHGKEGIATNSDAVSDRTGPGQNAERTNAQKEGVYGAYGPEAKARDNKSAVQPASPAAAGDGSALRGAASSKFDASVAQQRQDITNMRSDQQVSAQNQSAPIERGNQATDKSVSNQPPEQKLAQQSTTSSTSDKAQAAPHTESQQVKQSEKADSSVGVSAAERIDQQSTSQKNQTKEIAGTTPGTTSDTKPAQPATNNQPSETAGADKQRAESSKPTEASKSEQSREAVSSKSPAPETSDATAKRENPGQPERSQQNDKPRTEGNESVEAKRIDTKADQSADRSIGQLRSEAANKASEVPQGSGRLPEATTKTGDIPPPGKDGKPDASPAKSPDGKIVDQQTILGNMIEGDQSGRSVRPIKDAANPPGGAGGSSMGGRGDGSTAPSTKDGRGVDATTAGIKGSRPVESGAGAKVGCDQPRGIAVAHAQEFAESRHVRTIECKS